MPRVGGLWSGDCQNWKVHCASRGGRRLRTWVHSERAWERLDGNAVRQRRKSLRYGDRSVSLGGGGEKAR